MVFWSNLVVWMYFALQLGLYIYASLGILHDTAESEIPAGPKIKWSLSVSKSSALLINLNVALLILFLCRKSITWLTDRIPVDLVPLGGSLDRIHKAVAIGLCLWSAIHTVRHYATYVMVSRESWVQDSLFKMLFYRLTGLTGHLIWVFFLISVWPRRRFPLALFSWEAFMLLHRLSAMAIAVLISIHGMFCFLRINGRCSKATSWSWVAIPLACLILDRVWIWYDSRRLCYPIKAISHAGGVIELRFRKPALQFYRSGQWIRIAFEHRSVEPQVSLQWHPFTLTSAPEERFYASIHVKIVGDWTRALNDALSAQESIENTRVRLWIEGPFGSPSQSYHRYKKMVCIGAGIGQTPFASVLKSLWFARNDGLRVVYIGVCRNPTSFSWFHDILCSLEQQCGRDSWLTIRYHVTGRPRHAYGHCEFGRDPITGLQYTQTLFCRPDWPNTFRELEWGDHGQMPIGVFFCGPTALRQSLRRSLCNIRHDFYYESF